MNWDTEPATEKQLAYLKMFGYVPETPLNKTTAHDLISQFEEDPERRRIRNENQGRESLIYEEKRRENLAYYLHTDCDALAKALENASDKEDRFYAKDELKLKQDERIEFWKDTFRQPNDRQGESRKPMSFIAISVSSLKCQQRVKLKASYQPWINTRKLGTWIDRQIFSTR